MADLQGNLSENSTLQGTISNSDTLHGVLNVDELHGTLEAADILTGSLEEHESLRGELGIGGGGGITNDYNDLIHKPQINEVELVGNRSLPELDIQPTNTYANNIDINNLFN